MESPIAMNLFAVPPQKRAALQALLTLYGQSSLTTLPPALALTRLQIANDALAQDALRPLGWDGTVGALLELPPAEPLVVVADLHGMVNNLVTVLLHDDLLSHLFQGQGLLLLLGDGIHSETPGHMTAMDNSLLLMDLLLTLKGRFPQQVHYLLGNHDSFDPRVTKGGVRQNLLWEAALVRHRGSPYRDEMARFYELSPLIACGSHFAACHAGPPRTGELDRTLLIDARVYPEIARDLIWVRPRDGRFPHGYGNEDLDQLRHALDLAADALVIVGHTPRNRQDCAWRDPEGLHHHWVLNSAHPHQAAWLCYQHGAWQLRQTPLLSAAL